GRLFFRRRGQRRATRLAQRHAEGEMERALRGAGGERRALVDQPGERARVEARPKHGQHGGKVGSGRQELHRGLAKILWSHDAEGVAKPRGRNSHRIAMSIEFTGRTTPGSGTAPGPPGPRSAPRKDAGITSERTRAARKKTPREKNGEGVS